MNLLVSSLTLILKSLSHGMEFRHYKMLPCNVLKIAGNQNKIKSLGLTVYWANFMYRTNCSAC
jgi:hypothetical protein